MAKRRKKLLIAIGYAAMVQPPDLSYICRDSPERVNAIPEALAIFKRNGDDLSA
jgi:hypothetical protein